MHHGEHAEEKSPKAPNTARKTPKSRVFEPEVGHMLPESSCAGWASVSVPVCTAV